MKWSNNNLACLKTWIHLRVLDQHNEAFKEAAQIKMNQLTFWIQSSSPELRKIAAATICSQLDNMFRLWDKARYEKGSGMKKAAAEMLSVLTVGSKTISELAGKVDDNYLFKGETEDEALS
jgi:hypothetical protein